jgi:predicted nucleic acid-binding Zn ribbon protein
MTRRQERAEQRISELVDDALRGLEVRRQVRELQLREAFAEVVGAHAAAHCHAVALERGVLCIATAHTALAHQLRLDGPVLIAALNARIGTNAVHRLRFTPRG